MATLTEVLIAVRELSYDRFPIPVFVLKQKTGKFLTTTTGQFNIGGATSFLYPSCIHATTVQPAPAISKVDTITIGSSVATGDTFTALGITYTAVANDTPTLVATGLAALLNAQTPITNIYTVTSSSNVVTLTTILPNTSNTVTSSCTRSGTYIYTYSPTASEDTIDSLINDLNANGYPTAYTGYYSSEDKPNSLLVQSNTNMALNVSLYRRFFLSDFRIQNIIIDYYRIVLKITDMTLTELPTAILELEDWAIRHLILWVSISLVDMRRVAEMSASTFIGNFSDGSGGVAGGSNSQPGTSVTVNVGSVFSLTEDNSVTGKFFNEDFNRVGSDNVLGDKMSFWYRLFLQLRKKIEGQFNDFYFRDDNVINGNITLEKDLNYLAYFDSYPYTFSPISRDIMRM